MLELGDIFADGLTTAVYLYASIPILIAYAVAVIYLTRQPRNQPSLFGLRTAS